MNGQLIKELEEVGGELLPSTIRDCDEIIINQPSFTARIALWGGHLVSFTPTGQEDWLFQSENEGAVNRFGRRHFGAPVCWPWFGAHEVESDFPAHGLARYFRWKLLEVGRFKNGDIKVVLRLKSEDHPLVEEMWHQAFELQLTFRLGEGFSISLVAENKSDQPFAVSEAIHTYFKVSDNQKACVSGLEGVSYIDKVANGEMKTQEGVVSPCESMDRVYLNAPKVTELHDAKLKRKFVIETKGSHSTVLWNPGEALSKKRTDIEDDEYRSFVCVETANALDNQYVLESGDTHKLKLSVTSESL
ncbi:D-hexose-6-phosphate mutarotase [Marinomonas balearica]|uniref:Putative glucose-6-phosphate 1-epimerase n=1 Tax=Marinomonas balearica TaxID=491947 RepID=A0A4R6M2N1_9GAMM|nr:D-hexose-6-phosphate mutarotase [Marinomonas balearica]TDO95518.1 glucose-6-phosphate 1-epimerase [Marinomonas balearica]